jgi:glycine oxidase
MPNTQTQSIVVVGAGPVGLCSALAFAQAGRHVRVVDSGQRGAGWASGGMLGASYETLGRGDVPSSLTELAFESLALWPSLAGRLDIATLPNAVFVARTQDEAEFLAKLATDQRATLTEIGLPFGFVGLAAWRSEADLALNPRAALRALHNACGLAGVTFVSASVIDIAANCVTLTTGAKLHGDAIIIATGQGGGGLVSSLPELANLSPVKGQLLAVAADANTSLGQVIRAGRLYLIPRDHQIIIGATSTPDDHDATIIDIDAQHDLHQEAITLWPPLATAQVVESWAGLRPMTPDGLPIVGRSQQKDVFLAVGTYRNGWLLAPAIARRLVALVAGDDETASNLQPFCPQRFPN